jgi:hypothetical protein
MSKRRHAFKQGDMTKAVKAVVTAGLSVRRIEVSDGKFVLIPGKPGDEGEQQANEWDDVR